VSLTVAIATDDPSAIPADALAAIAGVEIGDPGEDALVLRRELDRASPVRGRAA
jgi:hypothetical protein